MKRRIALLTALFVLISALSVFAQGFSDMPQKDSKYYAAFEYAINKKLIAGDGTSLNPDSYITYAEALTIVSRIKPFDCPETDITYYGVAKDKWYYSTVAKAYTLGYITPDFDGRLMPERHIQKNDALAMIAKVYGKTAPTVATNELCTRADFVWEIYWNAPDGYNANVQTPTENPSEVPTEAPTEAATEFSDLRAQAAQEAMQVALGIRADGSSYVNTVVYKDQSQTGWASGNVSSSSSRPSGSNKPSGGNNKDDDDEEPTQAPTDKPTDPKDDEEEPTQPPTDEPTENEPTYDDYDGPIDNDKDNVIDDPFNDGWRPPGWVEGDDDDNSGSGGWDEEDEDFDINDADDPDYVPETKPKDDEDETDEPTDEESDAPTDDETDAPTDEESDAPSDDETDAPSDDESDTPTDEDTDAPSNEETDVPSNEATDIPSDDETDASTDEETDVTTEDIPATEPEEDAGDATEDETDENEDGEQDEPQLLAWLFSKDWWFS